MSDPIYPYNPDDDDSPAEKSLPRGPGRPKGAFAKERQEIQQMLDRMDCKPAEGLALIGMQKDPCVECDDKQQVSEYVMMLYLEIDDPVLMHTAQEANNKRYICPYCNGSGLTRIDTKLRIAAYQTLLDRTTPKLAAKKIEAAIQRPTVFRAHAMDEDAEANKFRAVMAIIANLEGGSEEIQSQAFAALDHLLASW